MERAMSQPPVDEKARARRNVRLAILHVLLALACLAGFVIAQIQRGA